MKEEQIKKLVKEVIKEFKNESKKEDKKKAYHNTRLLLRHYNELKDHVEKAINEVRQIDLDIENMDADEVYIHSIKRSKVRTIIMLTHVDISMKHLKEKQRRLGTPERFRALELFYLEDKKYEEIREELNCGANTPSRWIDQMVWELSIYLFGVDGLKLIV